MALLLILGIRSWMGEEAFGSWGWRIPFLLSGILLAVSIWIRLSLNDSPIFAKMKEEGKTSKRPLGEAFGEWKNAKIAILALFGATAGEAVVWYGGQFYALFFLTQTIKVPAVTAQIMIVTALALGTPGFILFGWLSDKIGRKPIRRRRVPAGGGDLFPDLQGNYPLRQSEARNRAGRVARDGDRRPRANARSSSRLPEPKNSRRVAIAKSALVNLSVNYANQEAPKGTPAVDHRRPDPVLNLAGLREGVACGGQGSWLSRIGRSGRDQYGHDPWCCYGCW